MIDQKSCLILKENWNSFDLLRFLNENHDPIADRIVDTLAVNKANVIDYIKDVEKFAKTYFDTPDWKYGGTSNTWEF